MSIRFDEGSAAYNLMYHLMHVAEFPYDSLNLIGNSDWLKRVVRRMVNKSYLSIVGKSENKSIRLRKKGVEKGKELFGQEVYDYYMEVSEGRRFRGEEARIWRNHRDAEVVSFLLNNNVKMLPSQKPILKLQGDNSYKLPTKEMWYYTSKEIKQVDSNGLLKVAFTRIKGVLFSPSGIYCVYNTNKSSIQWSDAGEAKIKRLVAVIANSNFEPNKEYDIEDAIIFGKGYETASEIFTQPKKRLKNVEFLSFENTFENIYFNNFEDVGKIQLMLITRKNWEQTLTKNVIPKEFREQKHLNVDSHGFNPNTKTYILMFFGSNVKQLNSFVRSSKLYANETNFEVLCFNWQKEFVESVVPDHVKIRSFNTRDILKVLSKE